MSDWRIQHEEIIVSFVKYLNAQTDEFVLKVM